MKKIVVDCSTKQYPIFISSDFLSLHDYILKKGRERKYIILTDQNIAKLHLNKLLLLFKKNQNNVQVYIVEPGEKEKSIENYGKIMSFLIDERMTREDTLITFGGGVIGDLGGFVASTYMRGIKLVHIPTTLLSQVDSSIGGKTAINFKKLKNYVGSFYQPEAVFINYSLLESLSIEEVKNGIVESIVHALIKDVTLFEYLEQNLEEIINGNFDYIEEFIFLSSSIKADIVSKDEKENDERCILNFGHTIGHAIESYYNYEYSHGRCVALGILGACFLSEKYGLLSSSDTERIACVLKRMDMITNIEGINVDEIFEYILHDKKVVHDNVVFILLNKIGSARKIHINNSDELRIIIGGIIEYCKK